MIIRLTQLSLVIYKEYSIRYAPLYPSPFGRLGEPAHSHGHITNLFVSSLMFVSQCLCGRRTSLCVEHEHLYVWDTNIFMCGTRTSLCVGHGHLYVWGTNIFMCGRRTSLCVGHKHLSVWETNIYTYIQDTPLYIHIDYSHHFGHFQLEIVQTNYIGPGGLCAQHMVVYASVAGHC